MSAYPYLGKIAPTIGGGLGGLPRRSVSQQASSDAGYNSVVPLIEPYTSLMTEGTSGGMTGRPSCIELDDGSFLMAVLTAASNISIQRFSVGVSQTTGLKSVQNIGSVCNVATSGGGSALLCRISATKVLLVSRSNAALTGWLIDVSSTTPTAGSTVLTANNDIPLVLLPCGNNSSLLFSITSGSSSLTAWVVNCSGTTPAFTLCTLAGPAWPGISGTNDAAGYFKATRLSDSKFIIYSVGSSLVTCDAQGMTLSGTTLTRTATLSLPPASTSGPTYAAMCRISDTSALSLHYKYNSSDTPAGASVANVISYDGTTLAILGTKLLDGTGKIASCASTAQGLHLIPVSGGNYLSFSNTTSQYSLSIIGIDSSGVPQLKSPELSFYSMVYPGSGGEFSQVWPAMPVSDTSAAARKSAVVCCEFAGVMSPCILYPTKVSL